MQEGRADLTLEDVHREGRAVLPLPTPATHPIPFRPLFRLLANSNFKVANSMQQKHDRQAGSLYGSNSKPKTSLSYMA